MGIIKLKKNTLGDCLMTGVIVAIGLAEACHLAAVFLGLPFSACSRLLGMALGVWLVLGTVLLAAGRRHILTEPGGKRRLDPSEKILYGMLALTVISQLIFIGMGNAIYRKGDMTVETVGSFLAVDGIYRVNPMTGTPYTEGMPLRLKILCLPTLYGSLCRWTGLEPGLMVQRIVPMAVLLGSYGAFSLLGRTLFPEEGRMRALFLLLVSALMWAGAYAYGMEGFDLLCSGWRGVSIRGGVLLPWTASLCLRRKWLGVCLCVLAEACMVWTFYGCGACLAMAAGLAAAGLLCRKLTGRARGGRAADGGRGGWEMTELLRNAASGWANYKGSGKMAALLLAALAYLWFTGRGKGQKALLLYASLAAACCVLPVTAALLMAYQTKFYDYEWIWSMVPLTAVTAYGAALFLAQQWKRMRGAGAGACP